MKAVLIASIGLAALSMLLPGAHAQQATTTIALVQKFQPVTRSYPGVSADMLGIRTGMTVSQAEAIAEKNYQGGPGEAKNPASFTSNNGVTAQSHPYVQSVEFGDQKGSTKDSLTMLFSSPVTGNTLYSMSRSIDFGLNNEVNQPPISTLKASLIKKYGQISEQDVNSWSYTVLTIRWFFTQKSKLICNGNTSNSNCVGGGVSLKLNSLAPMTHDMGDWASSLDSCGVYRGDPNLFMIKASNLFIIEASIIESAGGTKAQNMNVSIGDAAACMDDGSGVQKQLKVAAIDFFKSKTAAAPKF